MVRKAIDKLTILQAAVELANETGLEKVTLAELANRLGIKTPSLYNHIEGLNGLRKDLALYGVKQLRENLMQAAVGKSKDNAILSMGFAYVKFAKEQPGLYEATIPAYPDEEIGTAGDEIIQLMLRVLEEYNFDEEEGIHVVRGIRSILHGFASLEFKKGFGIAIDPYRSFEKLLTTYLRGLHQ